MRLNASVCGVSDMTDEELIERLRKADEYEPLGHDGWEAADRIEALVKDKRWIMEERDRTFALMLARAEAAEAKVEKLRGALMVARAHVANNAEGWSVSRGAARDDLTVVDATLTQKDRTDAE